MGASGASGSWLETIRKSAKQALSVQLGTILGLIVPVFALNRADNEKTLNAEIAPEERANIGIRIGQTSNSSSEALRRRRRR